MRLIALDLASFTEVDFPTWLIAVIILTIVLLFIGALLWLILTHVARSQELSHQERMKAIELGRPTGPSEAEKTQSKYLHNAFWICFWIGAVVPIAATSAASSIMIQTKLEEFSIILAIWICVAVISVAGVVCATVLMVSCRHWTSKGESVPHGKETGTVAGIE